MAVLRKIDVLSFTKLFTMVNFVLIVIFFIVMGTLEWTFNSLNLRDEGYRLSTYGVIMIGLIAFYTLAAAVFSALGAWLYNRFAQKFGGVKIELSEPFDKRR